MINNRQNNRRRGRGGGSNGIRPNGSSNGVDRGNRIDNRARGNANQLFEKYKTLARDAQTQGDRVMAEYYLQFADHYFRILNENRARFDDQQQQRRPRDDQYDQDDFGDEGENSADDGNFVQPVRQQREPQQEGYNQESRDQRPRQPSFNNYDDDNRGDCNVDQPRQENSRDYQPRNNDERPREYNREDRSARPQRPPANNYNDNGARAERNPEGQPNSRRRFTRDREEAPLDGSSDRDRPVAALQSDSAAAHGHAEDPAATPARGRRRQVRDRDEQPAVDERIEIDRLPPAFAATTDISEQNVEEEAPKPKRRGRPPKATSVADA